jgi:hypothetical protein
MLLYDSVTAFFNVFVLLEIIFFNDKATKPALFKSIEKKEGKVNI